MDEYIQFINKLEGNLPDFDKIDNIVSVYIGGSVSRGDYIVGASDIDMYVVCNIEDDNFKASFENYVQNISNEFLLEIKSWYPDVVSIAFTTYKDVKTGVSFLGKGADYYSFNDSGKLIYGSEIRNEIIKTDDEQNKKISKEVLKQLKEIISQDIPEELITRYFIRGAFGAVFSAVNSALILNGVYVRGKEKLVKELLKYDKVNGEKLQRIYDYWTRFPAYDFIESDNKAFLNLVKEVVLSL